MNYGNQLMFLKDRRGLTNVQMAAIIQISDSLYSRYEKEKQTIPITHLNTYAGKFNTSIDYFFCFTKEITYSKISKKINIEKSSKRLKQLRKDLKMKQTNFAKEIGFDNSTLCKYENAKQVISTTFLYNICKKYKISADYLLGKIDSPKYIK